ncbi:MAG: GntR family transcriptional regulator [Thermomicrobiales bacterium]
MSEPNATVAIKRTLAREHIYAELRDLILSGSLAPGERLHDLELADRLGVSRTPVREALRRLEDEGLVQTSPNRWTRVSPLDMNDARNLYPIIWKLEPLALQLAVDALDDAELEAMERANQRLAAALEANEAAAASSADVEFHQIFIDRCDNPALIAIIGDAKAKLSRIELHHFAQLASPAAVAEHAVVLSALELGDFAAASAALEANWQNAERRLFSHGEVA